jgi:hypothetical protein
MIPGLLQPGYGATHKHMLIVGVGHARLGLLTQFYAMTRTIADNNPVTIRFFLGESQESITLLFDPPGSLGAVFCNPRADRLKNGNKRFTGIRQMIVYPGGNFRVMGAYDKPVTFQFPQLFCQHPRADILQYVPQFIEPGFIIPNMPDDPGFPFPTDDRKVRLYLSMIFQISPFRFMLPGNNMITGYNNILATKIVPYRVHSRM